MRYSMSVAAAIAANAARTMAQDMYYYGNQFDARNLDDFYEYDARDIRDEYDLGARGFDDNFDLTSRDVYDGYGLEARDFGEYDFKPRSHDAEDSLFARDIFLAADPQAFASRSFFPSHFGSLHSLSMSPLSRMLSGLSSSAHRGHSHLMFANNHAFVVPPQHDPFDDFFDSFMPSMGHSSVMAHASVSSGTNGYACTSSTVIGADGIPRTTKHCTSNTPDSHISLMIGPDSSSHLDTDHDHDHDHDHDSDFFSHKFADIWDKPDSDSSRPTISLMEQKVQKLLRNKRILDLDSGPQRGEIHSFSTAEDSDHSDHADEDDNTHETHREKHDLRDAHALDEKEILKRDAEPEPEPVAEPIAKAEAEPEPEAEAEAKPDATPDMVAEAKL